MATLTTNVNFLQPSGFKVTIDRDNYPNLEFFAQSVEHPSVSASPGEIDFRGVRLPTTPDRIEFADLTMNILVDEDMTSYLEVFNWFKRLIEEPEQTPGQALDNAAAQPPSRADVTVTILTSHNNANKTIKYLDAFPVDIGSISLETTAGDAVFITCPITFKYTRFEIS